MFRVQVADAEHDRLLVWAAGREQVVEQVFRHRLCALGKDDVRLEALGLVMRALFGEARLAGHGIDDIAKIGGVEAGFALVRGLRLKKDVAPNDLADREIAVLDRLRNVVAVGGLAEIADIVCGDPLVLLRALFRLTFRASRARAGSQ